MNKKNNFRQALDQVFGIENGKTIETEEDHIYNVLNNIKNSDANMNSNVNSNVNTNTNINTNSGNYGEPPSMSSRTTVISEDTTIIGSIISSSDIDFRGRIIGDIDSKSTLFISGDVKGNVVGQDVQLSTAQILGDIKSATTVNISNQSIVNGTVSGDQIDLYGRVKGSLFVDSVIISKEAVLMGDINAKKVSIEPGARIKGRMNIESDIQPDEMDIKFDI